MTTKLIDREYYSDGFTGCGCCKWHFKACGKNFVVEWCDKMFDTPEPEAKAYWVTMMVTSLTGTNWPQAIIQIQRKPVLNV